MYCRVKLFAVLLVISILGISIPAVCAFLGLFHTSSPPNEAELQSALDKFNAAEKLGFKSAVVDTITSVEGGFSKKFRITARLFTGDEGNTESKTFIVRQLDPARNYIVNKIVQN